MCSHSLNRLIGTAVVDKTFQRALLRNPAGAAQEFDLEPYEFQLVAGIRAADITEFAQKLDAALSMELVPAGGPSLSPRSYPGRISVVRPGHLPPERPLALHLHTGS